MAKPISVFFRADAALSIGSGHVMRCLTLADELSRREARCTFVMRNLEGHLASLVEARGHAVRLLPKRETGWKGDADDTGAVIAADSPNWLVVDHYDLDARWEQAMASRAQALLAIDDLANRPHQCDLLLDQNLGREPSGYDRLLSGPALKLIGPKYALLRPEFAKKRPMSLARRQDGVIETLLVSLGGTDVDNLTAEVVLALDQMEELTTCRLIVVMGGTSPHVNEVSRRLESMRMSTELHVNVNDMASLMARADLAIGAAGGTAWERCCLGLPSLLIVMADNQQSGTAALDESGAAVAIGKAGDVSEKFPSAIRSLLSPGRALAMSEKAASLCDGYGAPRVVDQMFGGLK